MSCFRFPEVPATTPPTATAFCTRTQVEVALNSSMTVIDGNQAFWAPGENGTFSCRPGNDKKLTC